MSAAKQQIYHIVYTIMEILVMRRLFIFTRIDISVNSIKQIEIQVEICYHLLNFINTKHFISNNSFNILNYHSLDKISFKIIKIFKQPVIHRSRESCHSMRFFNRYMLPVSLNFYRTM